MRQEGFRVSQAQEARPRHCRFSIADFRLVVTNQVNWQLQVDSIGIHPLPGTGLVIAYWQSPISDWCLAINLIGNWQSKIGNVGLGYLPAGIAIVIFFLFRTTTTVELLLLFIAPDAERVTIDSPFTDSITSPARKPAANATLFGCA
jgi:hypothetical protein